MRRFAMTTLTVAAGLVALAPVASAEVSSAAPGGPACAYEGDDAFAFSAIPEDGPANALAQAPVGDSIFFERCGAGGDSSGVGVVPFER